MTYYTDDNLNSLSIARAVSKEPILTIEEELEDFNQAWRDRNNTIRKVIQLEQSLGHPVDLFDLYTSGKFTNQEIDSLTNDRILPWLLNGVDIVNRNGVDTDGNLELCNIIRLCPKREIRGVI